MPKATKTLANRQLKKVRVKFKISGRKSTKSALDLSNNELIEIALDKNAGRRRQTALSVLNRRNVKIPSSLDALVELIV